MKYFQVKSGHCHAPGRDVEEGEVLTCPGDLTEPTAKERVWNGLIVEIDPPEAPEAPGDYASLKVAELRELIEERGLDLGDAKKKDELIAVLEAADEEEAEQ